MKEEHQVVEDILDQYVCPRLAQQAQSDIELVEIRDRTAYVRLKGHCSGCPSAKYTLEGLVKEEIVKYTELVEDVKLYEEVSQELYDFARQILSQGKRG